MARLEAEIDFAEEDVPAVPRDDMRRTLEAIDESLRAILAGADRGLLQRHGFRVVLVGSPNVGKSSLMNALLATERAIVTEVPGTTRDVVEESFNLGRDPGAAERHGPGCDATDDPVERIGVDRSGAALAAADVAALVLDGSRALVRCRPGRRAAGNRGGKARHRHRQQERFAARNQHHGRPPISSARRCAIPAR